MLILEKSERKMSIQDYPSKAKFYFLLRDKDYLVPERIFS